MFISAVNSLWPSDVHDEHDITAVSNLPLSSKTGNEGQNSKRVEKLDKMRTLLERQTGFGGQALLGHNM